MLHRTSSTLVIAGLIGLLATACSRDHQESNVIRTGNLPEVALTEQFTISETPEGLLRQVNLVKPNSEGDIFVSDWGAYKIHHFSKDGRFIESIGGQGGDAGRFLLIKSFSFDSSGRLIVFDNRFERHTVFEKTDGRWAVADTFSFSPPHIGMIHHLKDNILLTEEVGDERLNENLFQIYYHLRLGTMDGELMDEPSLRIQGNQMIARRGVPPEEVPFSHRTFQQTDQDGNLYILETQSFAVRTYNSELAPTDTVYAPVARMNIRESDRQSARVRVSYDLREFSDQFLPNTKPVARSFFMDDQNRYWVRTYDSPEFLVLDTDGSPLGSFDLPAGFHLRHVANGKLYTSATLGRGDVVRVYNFELP